MHGQTDKTGRQKDRQTDGWTDRQTDRRMHGQTDRWMERQTKRQADGETDRQTDNYFIKDTATNLACIFAFHHQQTLGQGQEKQTLFLIAGMFVVCE